MCTLMRQVGKLLVVFYLDAEWDHVRRQVDAGISETDACKSVLGVTYDEIGIEAAQRWRLPELIRAGMTAFDPSRDDEPRQAQWMRAVTSYSTEVADLLTAPDMSQALRDSRIAELAQRYSRPLGTEPDVLIEMSITLAREEAGESVMREIDELRASADAIAREPLDPEQRIRAGVEDLRALPSDNALAPALTLASETVLAGLGFARTVVFVRHGGSLFKARMGFGPKIDEVMPRLTFTTAFEPDVFHLAIANSVGIFIENARDPKMLARLPEWYRRAFSDAHSFVLLPVMLENQSTVALLYGDWTHTDEPRRISQQEMAALNELSRELRRFFRASASGGSGDALSGMA